MDFLHKSKYVGDFAEDSGHDSSFSSYFNPIKLGTCTHLYRDLVTFLQVFYFKLVLRPNTNAAYWQKF